MNQPVEWVYVLLGVFLVAFVLMLVYLIGLLLRTQVPARMKQLNQGLRDLERDARQLRTQLEDYAGRSEGPYIDDVSRLRQKLDDAENRMKALRVDYSTVQQRINNDLSGSWRTWASIPWVWMSIRQDERLLEKGVEDVKTMTGEAANLLNRLNKKGWEVAQMAQTMRRTLLEAQEALDRLAQHGAEGDSFAQALTLHERMHQILDQLPAFFYSADERVVLAHADRDLIISVYQGLVTQQAALENLVRQAKDWETQHAEVRKAQAGLHRSLAEARQLFKSMPPELSLTDIEERLNQIDRAAHTLDAVLQHINVDEIRSLMREVNRLTRVAKEVTPFLQNARDQATALVDVVEEITAAQQSLSAHYHSLESRPAYPMVWDRTGLALSTLQQQMDIIGPVSRARTPDQVAYDLEDARTLRKSQQKHEAEYAETASQYEELVHLMDALEPVGFEQWQRSLRALLRQARNFSPDNFPPELSASLLGTELQTLTDDTTRLVERYLPKGKISQVKESELDKLLPRFGGLVERRRQLQAREAALSAALSALQSQEDAVRDRLNSLLISLNQVGLVAQHNAFLEEHAGQAAQPYINQVTEAINILEQRKVGLVAQKAEKSEALLLDVEQSAAGWVEQIAEDLLERRKILTGKLTELEAIAPLNDAQVNEARRLAALPELAMPRKGKSKNKPRLPLPEAVLQLKHSHDEWQRCVSAANALDSLYAPLRSVYQQAANVRQNAKAQWAAAGAAMDSTHGWPPSGVSAVDEQMSFEHLETQWNTLSTVPSTAINLMEKLSRLALAYQQHADAVRQMAQRAGEERQRVQDLELELEQAASRWQQLSLRLAGNALAGREIQKLLDEVQSTQLNLKRQARQGNLNQLEAERELETLLRRLQMARIPVGDGRVVGMDGE